MSIKAILFDLGGVLLRTGDFTPRERLAARLGLSRAELERLVFSGEAGDRAQLGLASLEEHWEYCRQQLGLPVDELPALQRDFWGGDRLDVDLVAYIRSLRGRYRTALLSNNFSNLRRLLTERWGIADAFDELIISSEAGLLKPDPRIFHLALARLGVAPEQAVFVDDFLHNVEGARAVGMHAVHFRDAEQMKAELERLLAE